MKKEIRLEKPEFGFIRADKLIEQENLECQCRKCQEKRKQNACKNNQDCSTSKEYRQD